MATKDLKYGIKDQRQNWIIIVLAKETPTLKERNYRFKLEEEDELRVDPKHLAYYILLQIACIKDHYKMHRILKEKYQRYLVRIY